MNVPNESEVVIPWPFSVPEPYIREHWSRDFGVITNDEISAFANGIEDTNLLHHDDSVAQKKKIQKQHLLGRIATGIRVMGYASPTIADNFPTGMLVEFENVRFPRPLYAGSMPTVSCSILKTTRKLTHVAFTVRNGFEVLAYGTCLIAHEG